MYKKWDSLNQVPNRSFIIANSKDLLSRSVADDTNDVEKQPYLLIQSNIRWLVWVGVTSNVQFSIRDILRER